MNRQPIKLYLLTGFLGAGKTTFLQRMMADLAGAKIGILMNEFGSISVDGILLKQGGIDVVEINNGSVFCSCLKGAFIDALIAYSELPIDYLFVEASGMADPSGIEHILGSVIGKLRGQEFAYQGSICVVDALNFLDQAEVLLALERQVAASSLILINKTDLADENTLQNVEEKIRSINTWAKLYRVSHCHLESEFWRQPLAKTQVSGALESCNNQGNRPVAHIIQVAGSFGKELFTAFLKAMLPLALRMKGFFMLEGEWYQIDTVGLQLEIKKTNINREQSELVIISSQGLPALQQIYENWDLRFQTPLALK